MFYGCYVCFLTAIINSAFHLLQLSEPMDGLKEWLTAVCTARIPCAVVSSLDRRKMVEVLERMGLNKYFQVDEIFFSFFFLKSLKGLYNFSYMSNYRNSNARIAFWLSALMCRLCHIWKYYFRQKFIAGLTGIPISVRFPNVFCFCFHFYLLKVMLSASACTVIYWKWCFLLLPTVYF